MKTNPIKEMKKRLIKTDSATGIKIYYSSEYKEYSVVIPNMPDATYFTDDKDDAIGTMKMMIKDMTKIKINPNKRKTSTVYIVTALYKDNKEITLIETKNFNEALAAKAVANKMFDFTKINFHTFYDLDDYKFKINKNIKQDVINYVKNTNIKSNPNNRTVMNNPSKRKINIDNANVELKKLINNENKARKSGALKAANSLKISRLALEKRINAKSYKKNPISDKVMTDEIILVGENVSKLYPQKLSILQNLARKKAKGTYDHAKAAKLWMYWVDSIVKYYSVDQMGEKKPTLTIVSKADREQMAEELEDYSYANDLDYMIEEMGLKRKTNPSKRKVMTAKKKAKPKAKLKKSVKAKKATTKRIASMKKSTPKKRTTIGKKMIPAQRGSIIGALKNIKTDKQYDAILYFDGKLDKPYTAWAKVPSGAAIYPNQADAKKIADKLVKSLPSGQQLFVINKNSSIESIKTDLLRKGFKVKK